MSDKEFLNKYEKLLDKGYCDCNEMNCIDNNSPRRILNIVKELQIQLQQKENIIKEVREKIKKDLDIGNQYVNYDFGTELLRQELLEILDKVD